MRRRIRPLSLVLVALVHLLVLGLVLVERHFMPERTAPEQLVYILPITVPQARDRAVATEARVPPQPRRQLPPLHVAIRRVVARAARVDRRTPMSDAFGTALASRDRPPP